MKIRIFVVPRFRRNALVGFGLCRGTMKAANFSAQSVVNIWRKWVSLRPCFGKLKAARLAGATNAAGAPLGRRIEVSF